MSAQTGRSTDGGEEKTISLDEASDVQIPVVELLTGRGFITGKSGSGKSNSASVVAEELLDDNLPLLIVDTEGEYYGLQEEYEMLHVGADDQCDLQVGPEHGEKLAELALTDNVPIILDVSGFIDEEEGSELIFETAKALFTKEKKQKKPFLMLVEEVHEYIPEKQGLDQTGKMLVKIAKRGRKHGLGIVGMSQRPADVKKDFITQANWLLWHRLTWNNDTKVVRQVADKETADEIEDLEDGEAFLMADWAEEDIQRVQVRRKRTFDAGATPGLDDFERPELKSISGDLVDELEEISKEQSRRQDRISQLEARVEELQLEKEEIKDELQAERQNNETVEKLADKLMGMSNADDSSGEALDEIRDEKNAEIRSLEKKLEERDERITELQSELADAQEELRQRPDIDERAVEAVEVLAEEFGVRDGDDETIRRKLKESRDRIEELEGKLETARTDADLPGEFEDSLSFLKHEAVKEAVDEANADITTSDDHTWNILFHLADDDIDSVHPDDATSVVDLHKENIRKVLNKLEDEAVVETVKPGRRKEYRLNVDGLERIVQNHKKRQEMEEFRDGL